MAASGAPRCVCSSCWVWSAGAGEVIGVVRCVERPGQYLRAVCFVVEVRGMCWFASGFRCCVVAPELACDGASVCTLRCAEVAAVRRILPASVSRVHLLPTTKR